MQAVIDLPREFPRELELGGLRFRPPDIAALNLDDIQIAIWPLVDPSQVQWVNPVEIVNGVSQFVVAAPPSGWVGNQAVLDLFIDGVFWYRYVFGLVG